MLLVDLIKQVPGVTQVNLMLVKDSPLKGEELTHALTFIGEDDCYLEVRKETGKPLRYFLFTKDTLDSEERMTSFSEYVKSSLFNEETFKTRNFAAGPCPLPSDAVKRIQAAVQEGSILEMSHRSAEFEAILNEAKTLFYQLSGLSPEEYEILFLQGGASLQFVMAPMNIKAFLAKDKIKGSYLVNGYWSQKAFEAGSQVCTCSADVMEDADFVHYVSNDTVEGIQLPPQTFPGKIVVCDASSDILLVETPKADIIYAHSQKVLGVAGVTIVAVRKALLYHSSLLPDVLNYQTYAKTNSIYNTPPIFSIFTVKEVLESLKNLSLKVETSTKGGYLRSYLGSSEFYKVTGNSLVTVCFTCPREEQLLTFLETRGIVGVKGHRSKGGLRISLYPWCSSADVAFLVSSLQQFEKF